MTATILQNDYIISYTLLISDRQCTNFSYNLALENENVEINSTILQIDLLDDNIFNIPHQLILTIYIVIDVLDCPPGFELSNTIGTCVCVIKTFQMHSEMCLAIFSHSK